MPGGGSPAEFAGESIPSLEEVLKTFGGQLKLNLELKEFRAGMAVLELLSQYPCAEFVVSSFNAESAAEFAVRERRSTPCRPFRLR